MVEDRNKQTFKKEFGNESLTIERYVSTKEIPEEEMIRLAAELTPLTGEGFMRFDPMSDELHKDVANHVVRAPRLIVVRDRNMEAVAFIASAVIDIQGLNFYDLGGIIVATRFQGSGLAEYLLRDELRETLAKGLVLRTQNRRMLGLAQKVAEVDDDFAAKIAPFTHYTHNLEGSVNRRVYRGGHSLYEDEVRFAPKAIDWIDWRSGDALVVAGWVKK